MINIEKRGYLYYNNVYKSEYSQKTHTLPFVGLFVYTEPKGERLKK